MLFLVSIFQSLYVSLSNNSWSNEIIMKLSRTAVLILVCGLSASTAAIFTEKAYAAPMDTSTAAFSGTVISSCTTTTEFLGNPRSYTPNKTLGPSGGVKILSRASTTAKFDCNSDTVTVGASVTVEQPSADNATAIVGIHEATVTVDPGGEGLSGDTGDLGEITAVTDEDGDVTVQVTSRWEGGEDLLEGVYRASIVVTVTAD
jgi:hypothetical protein